jgi:hypothetical protein
MPATGGTAGKSRPTRASLKVRAIIDAGSEHKVVELHDLSLHGAGVEGELPKIERGKEVSVRFVIPSPRPVNVEARCEVRHAQRGKHAGLRFLRLSYEASMAIHAFLESGGAGFSDIDPARAG